MPLFRTLVVRPKGMHTKKVFLWSNHKKKPPELGRKKRTIKQTKKNFLYCVIPLVCSVLPYLALVSVCTLLLVRAGGR